MADRRLTTIFSADVEGYSRLTEIDEVGTLETLRDYRDAMVGVIGRHKGRVVNTAGDSVLAEFVSPVEAVQAAAEVQRDLNARNKKLPTERHMRFRIGLNLGDVIPEGGDIFGEGVNIAARLQSLAEAGGICISSTVYDQVKHKLSLGFEDMGQQEVKNIAEPVRVYRVRSNVAAPGASMRAKPVATHRLFWVAALVIAVGGAAIGALYLRDHEPIPEAPTEPRVETAMLAGPSLAVRPFTNMSDNSEQGYFTDGITEDLITDLSKIPGLFVIARNTMLAYMGRPTKAKQMAEDLGVRYLLEGSVRRDGRKVRISVQLVDTTTQALLWAERYDGSLIDVFTLQDDITRKIITALSVELPKRDEALRGRRETDNPEAYDAFLVGWALYRRKTPDDFAKAIPYLDNAVLLDPDFGRAHVVLAAVYSEARIFDWAKRLNLSAEECWGLAEAHIHEAKKNPTALAHQVAAGMLSFQGQHEEAIFEAQQAIALDASDPAGYQVMANVQKAAGQAIRGAF